MDRRRVLSVLVGVLLSGGGESWSGDVGPGREGLWSSFWERHGRPDGRVVDSWASSQESKGGRRVEVTHTEGLGVALLAAQAAGDGVGFNRVWQQLQKMRRSDGLFSWLWHQDVAQGRGRVADVNNAVDGDLMVALACLRAGVRKEEQWGGQAGSYWREEGLKLGRVLISKCVWGPDGGEWRVEGGRLRGGSWVLGGVGGFKGEGYVLANPAYWLFEVFELLGVDGGLSEGERQQCRRVVETGDWLLSRCLDKWGMVPDWVEVSGKAGGAWDVKLNREGGRLKEDWVGYEATRVPIYVAGSKWLSRGTRERVLAFFRDRLKAGRAAQEGIGDGRKSEWGLSKGAIWVGTGVGGWHSVLAQEGAEVVRTGDYFDGYLVLLKSSLRGTG